MRLKDKVALITGASRGIGAAVAKRYAQEGAHVVLVARTVGGLEEVDDAILAATGSNATLVPLDLRQHDMIDNLGAMLYERFGRLDVLVGNAAILGGLSPVAHASPMDVDDVFKINVVANWRLLRACDPLLRRAEHGRVIMVSSGAAKAAIAFWGPYAASKAALEHLTLTYAAEVKPTRVHANIIDPGVVATRMRAQAFPGEDPTTLATPDDVAELFVRLACEDAPHAQRIVAGLH